MQANVINGLDQGDSNEKWLAFEYLKFKLIGYDVAYVSVW